MTTKTKFLLAALAVMGANAAHALVSKDIAYERTKGIEITTSNGGALVEDYLSGGMQYQVLGGAGTYFDPEKPAEIAAAIEALAGSPELRQRNAQLAFERAHAYSWARCARETFAVFDRVRLASSAAL